MAAITPPWVKQTITRKTGEIDLRIAVTGRYRCQS